MKKDFIVNISKGTAPVAQKGFGTILILDTEKDSEYKLFSKLESLTEDFEVGTKANKIGAKLFAQGVAEVAVVGLKYVDLTNSPEDLVAKVAEVAGQGWFTLTCTKNSEDVVKALSAFINGTEKMYAVTVQDKNIVKSIESEQTYVGYHNLEEDFFTEGLAGVLSVAPVGSITAKFKRVSGSVASDISLVDLETLHKDGGISYVEKMGVAQTSEGKTTSGEYIDVTLGAFYIQSQMEQALATLLINTPKIPYSNAGIALLVDVAGTVLKRATLQGIILNERGKGAYTINYLAREDVSKADIANRTYNGISWKAEIAGAIHDGIVAGQLVL